MSGTYLPSYGYHPCGHARRSSSSGPKSYSPSGALNNYYFGNYATTRRNRCYTMHGLSTRS